MFNFGVLASIHANISRNASDVRGVDPTCDSKKFASNLSKFVLHSGRNGELGVSITKAGKVIRIPVPDALRDRSSAVDCRLCAKNDFLMDFWYDEPVAFCGKMLLVTFR